MTQANKAQAIPIPNRDRVVDRFMKLEHHRCRPSRRGGTPAAVPELDR
jgi:hypothetical protein